MLCDITFMFYNMLRYVMFMLCGMNMLCCYIYNMICYIIFHVMLYNMFWYVYVI